MHWAISAVLYLLGLGICVLGILEVHLRRKYHTIRGEAVGVMRLINLIREGKYKTVQSIDKEVLPTTAKAEESAAVVRQDPLPGITQRKVRDGYGTDVQPSVFGVHQMDPTQSISVDAGMVIHVEPTEAYESVYGDPLY